jgi:hypothetical protein
MPYYKEGLNSCQKVQPSAHFHTKPPQIHNLKTSHHKSQIKVAQVVRHCRTPGAALPLCGTAALSAALPHLI